LKNWKKEHKYIQNILTHSILNKFWFKEEEEEFKEHRWNYNFIDNSYIALYYISVINDFVNYIKFTRRLPQLENLKN